MNKLKENKAITLVALIITIIVLLILAGVVINMTVGNNGIIGKTQGAVDMYKNAQEKEEAMLNTMLGKINLSEDQGGQTGNGGDNGNGNQGGQTGDENQGGLNTGSAISDYAQNGLILHLDGIQNTRAGHNDETTVWEDLTSNHFDATLSNCNIDSDCINFNGSSSYATLVDGALGNWGKETTIEIFAEVRNKSVLIADKSSNSHRCIGLLTNNTFSQSTANGSTQYKDFSTETDLFGEMVLYTLEWDGESFNNTSAYINGTSATMQNSVNSFTNNGSAYIGKRYAQNYTSYLLDGDIYSIRVYNRKLTEAEILSNYQVDKNRFNYTKRNKISLGYVEDGLIFHLDGIENSLLRHRKYTNLWEDISGNENNATLSNCTINENNIEFNGSSSYARLYTNLFTEFGESTIEVVLKPNRKSAVISDNTSISYRGLVVEDNNTVTPALCGQKTIAYKYSTEYSLFNTTRGYTLVYNENDYNDVDVYIDTVKATKTSTKGGLSNGLKYPIIGRRSWDGTTTYALSGNIYSIRVYNRKLTENEIISNHNIDKIRFGI